VVDPQASGYPFIVVASLAGLLADALVQILSARIFGVARLVWSIASGFITGLAATLLVFSYGMAAYETSASVVPLIIVSALTYLSLGFCYWAFINLNITSLRIRVLKEIRHAPAQFVRHDDLIKIYNFQDVVDRRIARLLGFGHLARSGNRLVVARRELLYLSRILRLARILILPNGSGRK